MRRLSSSRPLSRESHDFNTAKLRIARMERDHRRSTGEYAPLLSFANVTLGRTYSHRIPKARCHNDIGLFLLDW